MFSLRVHWGLAILAGVAILFSGVASATSFAVLLQDLNGDTEDCTQDVASIVVEDLHIDVREITTGSDAGFRVFGPGDAHFGSITIRLDSGSPSSQSLQAWWLEASRGKNIRKNITVQCLSRDGSPTRTYNYFECWPVRWQAGGQTDSPHGKAADVFTCLPGGLSIESNARPTPAADTTLTVGLTGDDGRVATDAINATWAGGEPMQIQDGPFNRFSHRVEIPGNRAVSNLHITTEVTSSAPALCDWITSAAKGKPWKQMVTVTEILSSGAKGGGKPPIRGGGSAGKPIFYYECFPARFIFPVLDRDEPSNVASETIVCKMGRVELR